MKRVSNNEVLQPAGATSIEAYTAGHILRWPGHLARTGNQHTPSRCVMMNIEMEHGQQEDRRKDIKITLKEH